MGFREQVAFMDRALLDVLGDEAEIEGMAEPVPGFFSAPWLQPKLGQINTGVREPVFCRSYRPREWHQGGDALGGQACT